MQEGRACPFLLSLNMAQTTTSLRLLTLSAAFLLTLGIGAQVRTEPAKQQKPKAGKVTVIQDSDLDDLVNNHKTKKSTAPAKSQAKDAKEQKSSKKDAPQSHKETKPQKPVTPVTAPVKDDSPKTDDETVSPEDPSLEELEAERRKLAERLRKEQAERARREAKQSEDKFNIAFGIPRARHKAKGFRIQVFTGGNSRNDKAAANSMSIKIKKAFPELSTYVHFQSPHWICRTGDFRNRQDADRYAAKIRKMKLSYETRVVSTTVLLAE